MAYQSDADTASTTTASSPKKSRSRTPSPSDHTTKLLSQDDLRSWWPFTRVDGRLLERAHKEYKAQEIANAEPAPY